MRLFPCFIDGIVRRAGVGVVLFVVITTVAAGQSYPKLDITRAVIDFPDVRLYYSLECERIKSYDVDSTQVSVTEDGIPVPLLAHHCPDAAVPCAMSLAIVADASGALAGAAGAQMREGLHAFVRGFRPGDEAAVVYYSDSASVAQSMTGDSTALHAAIDGIPGTGYRALYDGIYAGIEEVVSNGSGGCRGVIVLTGGNDVVSATHDYDDIIALATRFNVHLFPVSFGSGYNHNELMNMAYYTGGLGEAFYPDSLVHLPELLASWADYTRIGFEECSMTLQPSCADGKRHQVYVTVDNFCGGEVERARAYTAPLDSTAFNDLPMLLTDHDVTGISAFTMQLQLDTLLAGARFEALDFMLHYNDGHLALADVTPTTASFLDGVDVQYSRVAGGAHVRIEQPTLVSGYSALDFRFHTLVVPQDTLETEVHVSAATFDKGCYRLVIDPGSVRIRAGMPQVTCTTAGPDALTWQKSMQQYAPQPFAVTMNVENEGDGGATGLRFRLDYDTADVRLVAPAGTEIIPDPRELFPDAQHSAVWQLEARPRTQDDSISLRMTAFFDNAPPVTCTHRVYVPEAELTMQCGLDAPVITADQPKLRYDPMPFAVTLTVHNPGRDTLRNLRARIVLPVQFALAGADAPDRWVKNLLPAVLAPSESATQQWTITHPRSLMERTYSVGVQVYADNADASTCHALVTIPALDMPVLESSCDVPDSLRFVPQWDEYEPSLFWATLNCVNTGTLPAAHVRGSITLPPDMVLENAGDSLTKTFQPETMNPQHGQNVPYVRWLVRYTGRPYLTQRPEFRFRVTGESLTGIALDTARSSCVMRIPPVQPDWACALDLPDSLRLKQDGSDVTPNPFTLRFSVTNSATNAGALRRVRLDLPLQDGVSLHPSSPAGLDDSLDMVVGPNSTARFEWVVDVRNRVTRRDIALNVTVWDGAGAPITCGAVLPVAAVERQLVCTALEAPQSVCGDSGTTFTVRATLRNPGSINVNAPTALLEWTEQGGEPLLELDPGMPDNGNPQSRTVLFPQQEAAFTWHFRLRASQADGTARPALFGIRYGGEGVAEREGGSACAASLQILPQREAPITLIGAPAFCAGDSITLDAGEGYAAYRWSSGDTLRRIVVRQSGRYSVERTQSMYPYCPVSSDTVTVTVHPLPPKPEITRSGDTLTAPEADGWQWLRDGVAIPGATGRQFVVLASGSYAVRVRSAFGCVAESDPVQVTIAGLGDPPVAGLRIDVYPQPAQDRLTVRLSGPASGPLQLRMTDMLGREVLRRDLRHDGRAQTLSLDLSAHPNGAYLLRVTGPGGAQSRIILLARP